MNEIKVFNSSLFLFTSIKNVINRASQYSRTQAMFDIFRVIKDSLKFYADELTNRIVREEKMRFKDERYYESFICFVVNTAEYCKVISFKIFFYYL